MTDTQFVPPDVGIVQCQINDHKIGDQEFLEHVGADVTGTSLLVRPEDIQTRRFERRLDQFVVDGIEIDLDALAILLHTERHGDKGVWFHTSPLVSSDLF